MGGCWTREAGGELKRSKQFMGLVREHPRWLSGKESSCQCRRRRFDHWVGKISQRRKWQPAPVFLHGKSHGQRTLVGYSPQDHKVSDMP